MENRVPIPGEFYRHFKNRLYQIVAVAEHSETGEKMVVYQALYGDFRMYVRPLSMFVDEVDSKKYPDAQQKMRFQLVVPQRRETDKENAAKEEAERKAREEAERRAKEEAARKAKEEAERKVKEEAARKAKEEAERKAKEEAARKAKEEAERKAKEEAERKAKEEAERKAKEAAEWLSSTIEKFFDAETCHEKKNIFISLKDKLDKRMINDMAVSLDIVLEEDSIENQYKALLKCIETREKFEGRRLR